MNHLTFAICLALLPAKAMAGAMPWDSESTLFALSDTAVAITGDVSFSVLDGQLTLATAEGVEIGLEHLEDRSSAWAHGDPEVWAGSIFAIDADPGALVNGNTLCGEQDATFLVFSLFDDQIAGPFVQMAVFSGDAPESIGSEGLCGTLNYVTD